MSTERQIRANQANAQLSTGPTTLSGKATSSLNAVKTGLTGRTVLLPTDDAAAYESHVSRLADRFQPATEEERNLVQSLADTDWRLLRIPTLEAGIYALGRIQFAAQFAEHPEELRGALIDAQTFLSFQRQLNNLSIQEGRLRRQRDKDAAELQNLQKERLEKERRERAKRLDKEARQYIEYVHNETEYDENGFEFTIAEIERRALEIEPQLFREWALEQQKLKQSKKDAA